MPLDTDVVVTTKTITQIVTGQFTSTLKDVPGTVIDPRNGIPDQYISDTTTFFDPFKPFTLLLWLSFKLVGSIAYSFVYIIQTVGYAIVSTTFQITFSAHSIIYIMLIISTPLYAYIRYTYLTVYSRLSLIHI